MRPPLNRQLYPRTTRRSAFTILELLVVMSIIAIVAAFLIPSLGTSSGRALDAATRQFVGDLENARLTAIAERTHTRVIVPISEIPILGTNLTLRSYVIASLDKTSGKWTQRSKLNRLTTSVAFDPTQGILQPSASPAPSPTILISDKSFTAPYVEFRSDGST